MDNIAGLDVLEKQNFLPPARISTSDYSAHYLVSVMTMLSWWLLLIQVIPSQTWTGLESSRWMRLPDFKTFGT